MKTKHTPGEWVAKGSEINRKTWVECKGKRICTITENEQDWDNAKLIAAAPELLQVAIDLKNAFIHKDGDAKGNQTRSDIFRRRYTTSHSPFLMFLAKMTISPKCLSPFCFVGCVVC